MRLPNFGQNENTLTKYLSPLAVWALAFGCAVGWGAFMMPGTTFLPPAGPLGASAGLLIGACIMLIIGVNYHILIKRFPGPGGSYTFAGKVLGADHGFLCAWMLLLTYIAVVWANSTALSLMIRYIFGDIFCFGFSYTIAGYPIYLGEVLLSVAVIAVAWGFCVFGKNAAKWFQVICAVLLFAGISVCFVSVVIHRGGFDRLLPAFSRQGSAASQILSIVILAPWAYIGFESISHSSGEFRFSAKKSLPVMAAALLTAVLAYIMLVICAALATPDGYANWGEYIYKLATFEGIKGIPTFYAAREAMGSTGLVLLGISAFCGIATALVGNFIALGRLIHALSRDNMAPKKLGKISARGVPANAITLVAAVSCAIPFFGRTAIGWIVDVTTIGATLVYTYTSVSALVVGIREKKRVNMLFGIAGTLFSITFAVFYLTPGFLKENELPPESYLILIIWSVLGMLVFRVLLGKDRTRTLGKSEIVWIILFLLIMIVSVVWLNQIISGEAIETVARIRVSGEYEGTANPVFDFKDKLMTNIIVQMCLILAAFSVIVSIFTVIKKREKQIEAERLLAEESSKAKTTFLSNMSHDIRTPMNAITGYTALALREKDNPEAVHRYLDKIDTSSKHLLSLINDILDMSRIESGKMSLDVAPADICAILDEARDLFKLQMQTKDITFTVDSSGVTDRYVVCDKNRLNRILLNLISNACKYTNQGGRVEATLRQTSLNNGTGTYVLKIADNGIGMSPEFAERIFEEFERERSLAVNQIQGTGLGMSITKSLVELMGGTITLKTQKDVGSEFTITLNFPVTSSEAAKDENPHGVPEAKKQDFGGIRILIADDNPINSEIASAILSQEGFETEVAENGQRAVDMVEQADEDYYSVVLMDIQMPVLNGYDATRKIRALPGKRGRIPVIAVTANTFEDDRKNAREAGMNAHVAKPFSPEKLIETIANQL